MSSDVTTASTSSHLNSSSSTHSSLSTFVTLQSGESLPRRYRARHAYSVLYLISGMHSPGAWPLPLLSKSLMYCPLYSFSVALAVGCPINKSPPHDDGTSRVESMLYSTAPVQVNTGTCPALSASRYPTLSIIMTLFTVTEDKPNKNGDEESVP
jgi:hypothetical protein